MLKFVRHVFRIHETYESDSVERARLKYPPTDDQDGDGRLGYEDTVWLMKATDPTDVQLEWSTANFAEICDFLGASDKLISKDQLYVSYESRLGSIEEDWDRIRALRPKQKPPRSASHDRKGGGDAGNAGDISRIHFARRTSEDVLTTVRGPKDAPRTTKAQRLRDAQVRTPPISSNSCSAFSHCPPFSHAVIVAL